MSVFSKKLNTLLKACLLAAGVSSISFSVSAFELYQGEVVLFGGDSSGSKESALEEKVVVAPSSSQSYELKPHEPRSGEVILESSLPVPNRHSNVMILPQSNEVQFLDQSERKSLLILLSHLQQTDGLIQRAQAYQRPDQRIKFRYDWLRQDFHKINRSILDHLNSPENQTRFFEPLNDDYRR
jgi:RAQPRD family integrative conjugative element protein